MRLIVATGNEGKMREFARILAPLGFEVFSQKQAGLSLAVEETGQTFLENARLKAQAVFAATGQAAVADDSGLCVDALGGEPGVYSARWMGEAAPYREVKLPALLGKLEGIPREKRTARFVSAICCVLPDGTQVEAEGCCEGWIGYEIRGSEGFGYDPVFMVGEHSFGELSGPEKDALSHRGVALRALCQKLRRQLG